MGTAYGREFSYDDVNTVTEAVRGGRKLAQAGTSTLGLMALKEFTGRPSGTLLPVRP